MTDEELQRAIQDVGENIEKLSNSDKPLTKKENGYKQELLHRQRVLYKIKEAKEKNRRDDEMYNSILYSLLTSRIGKYPFLVRFIMNKFRWEIS